MDPQLKPPTATVRFQNHQPTTSTATIVKKQPSQKKTSDPYIEFHSPHHRSDSAENPIPSTYASPAGSPALPDNSKAIVSFDKYTQYTPRRSPLNPNPRSPSENDVRSSAGGNGTREGGWKKTVFVGGDSGRGRGGVEEDEEERERSSSPVTTILRRSKSREMKEKAALGFRITEVIVCLISFSVMAADKTQGWSGDSFDRYREYRFCLSVNIIGFVYATFQACNLTCHLITEKHILNHHLRCHFDFFMDQILAYLIIAASSAAATRVIDWQSNWGKDEFTEMASGSIATSFLAFLAFAISSLISGYNLCTHDFA